MNTICNAMGLGFVLGIVVGAIFVFIVMTAWDWRDYTKQDKGVSVKGAKPYQSNESWGGSYMEDDDE